MLDLVRAYENYLTKVKQASTNTVSSYMRDIKQYAQWLDETAGMDVVDRIAAVETDENDEPITPVIVKQVIINE